ncbi:MAG: ATP-binding protein, partial [Ruminococcus sp.]|nr:ATP-binding protein [Ruminococcus sp.]
GTSKTKTNTPGISATVSRSSTKGESQSTAHGDTVGGSVGTYVGGGVGVVHAGESASVNYNHSYTRTTGTSSSKTNGTSRSRNQSTSLAAAVNKTLTHGTSSSAADTTGETLSRSTSLGESHGTNEQKGTSYSVANGFSLMNSRTLSSTLGSSQGITLNAQNKTLLAMMEKIDKQLKRIEECESAGMWEFAAYFLADNRGTSETAASIYRSLISGEQTCLEHSAINTWDIASSEDLLLKEYLLKFRHPRFCYSGFDYDASRQVMISPAAMTSTNELAIQMGLPRKSVCGLPVIEHAEFAREVVAYHNNREDKASFELGRIFHMGKEYTTKVALQRDSMTMHTFITGATGSGKSNAVYNILDKLCRSSQEQIPFLVIEPAKGEYKHVFGQNLDVHVYGANPHTAPLLKINPFSFPHRIHVLEHLDRLVEIFNVCWPMYAAMPAVLKSAVEKAYTDCGWNLTESINEYGEDLYPSFADVARNIKSIIDSSEYDTENKGAYKGSLLTRLNSLSNGINGLIFSSDEIADADLFDRNVIVDLSRVGSAETKSLIMGMLVLKLQEYRMAQDEMNAPLRHITVLEEAHHLLKHTSSEQHAESSNLLGKSVEMLTNSIAEMRTYGEGFIIADQSPALLDRAVIRNTNTKVILRLADRSDCELTGLSVGLNENQLQELTKLERGGAVIYQNDWIAPVLCKIDKFEIPEGKYTYTHSKSAAAQKHPADSVYIAELLSRGEAVAKEVLEADILPKLKALGMGASVQIAAIRMLHNPSSEPDMVRLAPIMSALLPRVRAAIEQAYQNTSDAAEWTKYAEKILIEIAGREMDRKISGRIIQAIVTDYVYVELNRLDDLRIWTESGGLR